MAEITIDLACGGKLVTFIMCKSERDLLNKLRAGNKKGWVNFGHVKLADASVLYAGYKMHGVH